MIQEKQLSPKQVARAIGVSEASLKRWCDKGLIHSIRTPGGHRRIPLAHVLEFVRESGHRLVRPEVLGLPSSVGRGPAVFARAQADLIAALLLGDEETCRSIVFNLYLGGHSLCDICDEVLAHAFHAIGEQWSHGEAEVYQERRAVEIILRVLHEMRRSLPILPLKAPYALGATVEGDPYTLAATMIELSLREAGWRAEFFGSLLPLETLAAAVRDLRPRLCFISVSWLDPKDEDQFIEKYDHLWRTTQELGVSMMVGGRALQQELRARMRFTAYCERLRHVVSFATSFDIPGRKDLEKLTG